MLLVKVFTDEDSVTLVTFLLRDPCLTQAQCARAAKKQHPCKDLRHWPLIQAVEGVETLSNIVVFDSNPMSYETDQIHCFCGKKDDGSEMIQCDRCNVFYHSLCIGVTGADLEGVEFECGYCAGKFNGDGKEEWSGDLAVRPGKKRAVRPKPRSLAEVEQRLERYERGEKEWVGPRSWPEVQKKVRDHAEELRGKEEEQYRMLEEKRKQGDHHVADVAVGGGVTLAPLSQELLDYVKGNGWLAKK